RGPRADFARWGGSAGAVRGQDPPRLMLGARWRLRSVPTANQGDHELCFGNTVLPPTTVRFTLIPMISVGGTSCGSFSRNTKSASLPAVIDPFTCSSDDAYAPLSVAIVSASSTATF